MHIIDIDSHFIVNKGLDGSPLRVEILSDGGHLIEFNRTQLDIAPPQGKVPRQRKPALDVRTYWDLDPIGHAKGISYFLRRSSNAPSTGRPSPRCSDSNPRLMH